MKLLQSISLPALLGAVQATITETGDIRNIAHPCTDGSQDFEVTFTYNPTTEGGHEISLGNVVVGSCSGADVSVVSSGDTHTITAPHPWDCGFPDNRNSSISSYSYDMEFGFDAVFASQGIDIIQNSYLKAVGCSYEDSYSTSFNFNEDTISMPGSDDGAVDGDTALSFDMNSFTDNTYTQETGNVTLEAGNMAYLQVSVNGNFDAAIMEWSVSSCVINETSSGMTYPLFDALANQCTNDNLFFSIAEENSMTQVNYMIFLFDIPTLQQNYEIDCNVEVCMKSANNSPCDQVSAACGLDDDESGST
jgi:hypothetical protein